MRATPLQQLATLALGRDVIEWAIERRSAADEPSYRTIATELRLASDGAVDVTDETIRLWCTSEPEQASA